MRSIATTALITAAILTSGCNTIHGVGRDVSSLKEVVPGGSNHAKADTAAAPTAAPAEAPAGTQ
jgi:predicted small secreted protein